MRSAGLLPYRFDTGLEVLIAHPGGPFWQKKDLGAWSVVKGIVDDGEDERAAAEREFEEETGWLVRSTGWISLGETTLRSRKVVAAWAVEADFDLTTFNPGTFTLHGRQYPEIDRVLWASPDEARERLNPAQTAFIDRLEEFLDNRDR